MKTSRNFYLDNEDLRFQVEQVPWGQLLPLVDTEHASGANVQEHVQHQHELLVALGEYVAEQVAPFAHELDEQHPTLKDGEVEDAPRMKAIIEGLSQMGAMSIPFESRLGGLNMPIIISSVLSEMLARADVSVMTYAGFFSGMGLALGLHSVEEGSFETSEGQLKSTRFDEQIKTMCAGKEVGAMLLTEPQAGSDLAQINSKATQAADGTWEITGQKIWITCGHGEHHIVLARSEDSKTHPGLKGLSLFYVPAHIEKEGRRVRNVEIGGFEKKMGQNSLVTATINFDESRAELIGQRGHGFRGMSLLMNSARIIVGFEGLGLCEAAYRMAKAYAYERVTMGKPIAHHEMIADYLDEMDVQICGLRALCFEAGVHEELANRQKIQLKIKPPTDEGERKKIRQSIRRFTWKSRMATPLVKYTAGEQSVNFARRCMQILGGVGYMKEYGAEKLMRDALVIPVYEGTSQIQALMALKDHMQHAMRNPAKFLAAMARANLDASAAKDPLTKAVARLRALYFATVQSILTRIVMDKVGDLKGKPLLEWKSLFLNEWDSKTDFSFGLLHAERFAKIAADVAMAKVLFRQYRAVEDKATKEKRRDIALRFVERAEPKCKGLLREIELSKTTTYPRLCKV